MGSVRPEDSISHEGGGCHVPVPALGYVESPLKGSDIVDVLNLLDVSDRKCAFDRYMDSYNSYCRLVANVSLNGSGVSSVKSGTNGFVQGNSALTGSVEVSQERSLQSELVDKTDTERSEFMSSSSVGDSTPRTLPSGFSYVKLLRETSVETVSSVLGLWPKIYQLLSQPAEVFLPFSCTESVVVVGGELGFHLIDRSVVKALSSRQVFSYNEAVVGLARKTSFSYGTYGDSLRRQSLPYADSFSSQILKLEDRVGGCGDERVVSSSDCYSEFSAVSLESPKVVVETCCVLHECSVDLSAFISLFSAPFVCCASEADVFVVREVLGPSVRVGTPTQLAIVKPERVVVLLLPGSVFGRRSWRRILLSGGSRVDFLIYGKGVNSVESFRKLVAADYPGVVERNCSKFDFCVSCSGSSSPSLPGLVQVLSGGVAPLVRSPSSLSLFPRWGSDLVCCTGIRICEPQLATSILAIDCEMMTGTTRTQTGFSVLGRVSIVNYFGQTVYDSFVFPTDTQVKSTNYAYGSGITWKNIKKSAGAIPFDVARREVLSLLSGRVVVGHDVANDFRVLRVSPVDCHIVVCDTQRLDCYGGKAGQKKGLAKMVSGYLGRSIQAGKSGHSSVEDAVATMALFKHREEAIRREIELPGSLFPSPDLSLLTEFLALR